MQSPEVNVRLKNIGFSWYDVYLSIYFTISTYGSIITRILSSSLSIRLLMVAVGEIDMYPHFSSSSECQSCAGNAIVAASGGELLYLSENGSNNSNSNRNSNSNSNSYIREL